jgi:hypothetical protein
MSNSTSDSNAPTSDSDNGITPSADQDDVVRIRGSLDENGTPFARLVLTPNHDKRVKEILFERRPAIPVIFLPGVMGSLLVNKDTGATVWHPPNIDAVGSTITGVASVLAGWFASAASREKRFNPDDAVVDTSGPIIDGKETISEQEAKRRGWNTVHRWSYQPTLLWLEHTLNRPMLAGVPYGEWAEGSKDGEKAALHAVLGTHPTTYGGHGPGETITVDSEVYKSLIRYRYPVYAIGYNWLQSNQLSAQQVLDGVDARNPRTKKITRIMGIREICRENHTDKAIIITHSMGGLVARMASQLCGGEKDILGVIHGAQPATGAPLFAKRFRTGGEDFVNQSLLGRNDAEFVAIASNAEGPMELSPMPDYNDGKPWWIFVDKEGKERMALPQKSALDELYVNDAWYGLLPDSALLDPAGIVQMKLKRDGKNVTVLENYKNAMLTVAQRQESLRNNYHPNTYAMYGNGALKPRFSRDGQASLKLEATKPEEKLKTWGKVVWRGDFPEGIGERELKTAKLVQDDHHGALKIAIGGQTITITVQQEATAPKPGQSDNGIIPGDGTVPVWSAEAQSRGVTPALPMISSKAKGVQMVFVQGGYEHQFCFRHPWSRWATLYSVAQIVHSLGETFK